ncbi:MAG TPA: DUF1648 domain-containing protein [Steroidobacteraceae bacterium]|nr:DUF1648 domain-containing protein [Steroidobacteraceae bacterium]
MGAAHRIPNDSQSTVPPALLALVICAGVFIWLSSQSLPEVVASHFDGAGRVNGYMRRAPYIATLMVILVLPLLVVIVTNRALAAPNARINLPNREYWLAPERRDETIRFISGETSTLASLLIIFLCYVQWLVVRANAHSPPALDSRAMIAGLTVLLACMLFSAWRLVRRFRREA